MELPVFCYEILQKTLTKFHLEVELDVLSRFLIIFLLLYVILKGCLKTEHLTLSKFTFTGDVLVDNLSKRLLHFMVLIQSNFFLD
jgi:hypothetical protein